MYTTIIFLFLILISFCIGEKKGYKGLYRFDKATTLPLRGTLALLIIAHHLGQRSTIYLLSPITAGIGAQIVAIFFFISGYGLCVSYLSKGEDYLVGFLNKRLGKLLPKFIFLTVGMILLYHFLWNITIGQQAKNLVFGGITPLPFSWFIYAIIYTYVSFYTCSLIVKKPVKLGILFTVTTLIYISIETKILHHPSHWYITILCINLGYFTAIYEKSITKIIDKNKIVCYSILSLALVSSYELVKFNVNVELFTTLWMMIQAFSAYIVIRTLKFFQWNWLCKIGIFSLEIYLIHGIILMVGQRLGLENWLLWTFTYAISIPSAIILTKIFDLISQSKIFYKFNINKIN